jgi:hypothetical protein
MVVQHIRNQGFVPRFLFAPLCFSLANSYLVWTTTRQTPIPVGRKKWNGNLSNDGSFPRRVIGFGVG